MAMCSVTSGVWYGGYGDVWSHWCCMVTVVMCGVASDV